MAKKMSKNQVIVPSPAIQQVSELYYLWKMIIFTATTIITMKHSQLVSHYNSPLGWMTLLSDGEALIGLWFNGQQHFGRSMANKVMEADCEALRLTRQWLDDYFAGRQPSFTPPLHLHGTAFEQRVWNHLLSIPYGHTTDYGTLARRLADKNGVKYISPRAIGGAVGRNRILLIIPCHRVIGANRNLTGYAGGLERKQWLLNWEQSHMKLTIRPATTDDLPRITQVLAEAKNIMRRSGNKQQWVGNYPSEEIILNDIRIGGGHVVETDNSIVAYFTILPSPEPTYKRIFKGQWIDNEKPYHVVHRIGSIPHVHGIFRFIMDYCFSIDSNIRIDTHRHNRIMQHCIDEYGFQYCGIIYLQSGDERLAYQLLKPSPEKQ